MKPLINTRKYPRKPLEGFATITIHEFNKQISVPIETISRKGIGVFAKEKIKPGTHLEIKLYYTLEKRPLENRFTGVVTGEEIRDQFGVIHIVFETEINPVEHDQLFQYLETG